MSLTAEILQLSHQLKRERLYVNTERQQLLKLNEEAKNIAEQLFHNLWKAKQQREYLDHLVHANESQKQAECCSYVNHLDKVTFVDSYHYLSYNDVRVGELLKHLRDNPYLLARCIAICEDDNSEAARNLINVCIACIYGNCLMQEDELSVLHLLETLMHLKLLTHNDPRKLIRRTSLSFSVAFKQLFDILFSARLFLTAAIHDPVMRLLMEDEWFYDIDPDKAVVRFPKAERARRFGEFGSDEYKTKLANYRKFIVDKLVILTNYFVHSIKNNMHCFPSSLSWLVSQIYHAFCKRNVLTVAEIRVLCTDLVFSLFICPAICDPEPHGITSDIPISHIARHNLMQIAQIIQILALYKSDDDIDPKLRDLYSRFDKGDMCSVLDTILEGPALQLPTQSVVSQDFCRSAVLLTSTQLTGLISTLRSVASQFADDSAEVKQLRDVLASIPQPLGHLPRHVTATTMTPPGTPPQKRATSTPVTPTQARKSKNNKKKTLSPPSVDDNLREPGDDGTEPGDMSGRVEVHEDVLVITMVPERECPGMLSEHKVLCTEEENRISGEQPVVEIQEKRTRFSLSQDQESIGNNSDNQEAVSEAASSHSVGSVDMENDNDNFSDMLSANVSGRGTPSISGRDTPLSQAESYRVVQVTTPKADADDMGDLFGKFEIKAQEFESEAKSTVSDTWSTDVMASDSEPPEQNPYERLEEVTEEFVRQNLLKGPDICETASDAWSTDVLASDTEDKQSEFTDVEQPDLERDDLSGMEGASAHSVEIRVMDMWDNPELELIEDRSRDFCDVGSGLELPPCHSASCDSFLSENAEITPPFTDPGSDRDVSVESDRGYEKYRRGYRRGHRRGSPKSESGYRCDERGGPGVGEGKTCFGDDKGDVSATVTSTYSVDLWKSSRNGANADPSYKGGGFDDKRKEAFVAADEKWDGSTESRSRQTVDGDGLFCSEADAATVDPRESGCDSVSARALMRDVSDQRVGSTSLSLFGGKSDTSGATSSAKISTGARPKVKLSVIRQGGAKHTDSRTVKLDRGSDLLGESFTDDVEGTSQSSVIRVSSQPSDGTRSSSEIAVTDSKKVKLNRGSELLGETSTDQREIEIIRDGSQPSDYPRSGSDLTMNEITLSSRSSVDATSGYSSNSDVRGSNNIENLQSRISDGKTRTGSLPLVKDRLISSARLSGEIKKSSSSLNTCDNLIGSNLGHRGGDLLRPTARDGSDNYRSADAENKRVVMESNIAAPLPTAVSHSGKVVLGNLPQTDSGISEMEVSIDEAETAASSGDSLKLSEQQNARLDSKRLSATMLMYDAEPSAASGLTDNVDLVAPSRGSGSVKSSLFVATAARPRHDSSGSSHSATSANLPYDSPSLSETSSLKSEEKGGDDEGRGEKKKGIFNKMKERFHKGMMKKGAKVEKYDDVFSHKSEKKEPDIVVTESSDDILDKYRKKVVLASGDGLPDNSEESGIGPRKERIPSKGDQFESAPIYDPNNVEDCFAFHDAKRKLRLVLSTGDFNIGVGIVSPRSALAPIVGDGKENRDENDLVKLLRVQLAEALNLQNKDLIAQLHEGIRCARIFDNAACKKLLRSLRTEYRSRAAYVSYLVRCRQGLLLSISHLEQLHKRVLRDKEIVSKHFTNVCVRLFLEARDRSVLKLMSDFQKLTVSDEKTDLVERFLQYLYQQVATDAMWSAADTTQRADACLAIERVIMSRIYTHAMFPNGDGDIYRDQILQQHIKKISAIITPQHKDLCIPRTYHHECPWPAAQREIYMINAYKTPKDKLQCVLRSAQTIMNLLSMASENSIPAADDFVPVFIYVIIKANPPCLLSTIQYVNSFYDDRLAGEEHYWWMQFISAVEFIKTMD